MLSNKWTFSLTSLVVMLALAFVAPSAMADPFAVTLSVATAVDDDASPDISGVSADVEVETDSNNTSVGAVNIRIVTGLVVNLASNQATPATDILQTAILILQPSIVMVARLMHRTYKQLPTIQRQLLMVKTSRRSCCNPRQVLRWS